MGQLSEPTEATNTQTTIDQVLGVYQGSQGMMVQVLTEIREMKQLQRDMHQEMATHNTNMGRLIGVLQDINITLCRAFPPPPIPSCGPPTSGPSTSVADTGREALWEEDTSAEIPVLAAADPPSPKGGGVHPKIEEV